MSLYNDASLVMIPSAYKDGKLYSIKPTDGSGDFTFSRGSNLAATRVDENGLIEKGRENLLLQSNSFDTTWSTFSSSVTSGQSGYDGTNDAWELEVTAASGSLRQAISSSGVVAYSVYAKAGTANYIRLRFDAAIQVNIWFNLADGSVGTNNSGIGGFIDDVGNGWYRVTAVANTSSLTQVRIYPTPSDALGGDTGDTIYIQDAQLEAGLVATDYIETTTTTAQAGILEDMPRLDYSGSCPSLLLEPTRTNILTYSEYFEPAVYGKINLSITTNTGVSLEGFENASLVIPNAALGDRYLTNSTNSGLSTSSLFFKKKELRYAKFGNAQSAVVIDLESGTLSAESISTNFFSIKDYGNGWYRVSCYNSLSTNLQLQLFAGIDANGNNIATNGTDGFYIYGFQLESGSYPTSYIPCYGAATTRSSDSCSKTGISSLIGQEQGTIFVEATNFFASGLRTIATLWTSSSAFYQVYINASNQVRVDISGSFIFLGGSIAANTNYKIAFAYKSGEYALYINGTQIAISTNTTIPSSLTDYYLGNLLGGEQSGEFAQTALFKTRLTNGELAALTTI